MWMNQIKLKGKIAIIFILCVLVPLITTNSFIFWNLKQRSDKEQMQELENVMDRLIYELRNAVMEQVSIADYLSRNVKLQEFLEKQYESPSEYYDAYTKLQQDDVIHYYYAGQSANNVVVCTENETITNGSYFVKASQMQQADWYQAFTESGRYVFVYSYYEDGQESGGYIEKGRHIVVMRKLNFGTGNDFIMMDLDYLELLKKVIMECKNADCYICAGQQILLSNTEKNSQKKNFENWSEDRKRDSVYTQNLKMYGENFTVCITKDKSLLTDIIQEQSGRLFLLYVMNLLLPTLVVYLFYRSLHDRIALTQKYMDQVKEGIYEVIPCEEGSDEIGDMLRSYNRMTLQIKDLIEVVFKNKEREQNLELSRKQAELNALQSQLNPHFIFNALESIRMHSVLKKETETAKILENFAVLMRNNIRWSKDFVEIAEECDNVRRYLEIQKYRFGHRMEFSIYVQEECEKYLIPRFVIITFVENACVHGIEQSIEGGSITVVVTEDEEHLFFEILDSGSGMPPEQLEKLQQVVSEADMKYIQNARKSIGIVNTVIRLKQYYKEDVQIDISSEQGEGTEICIQIPKNINQESLGGNI